MYKIAIPSYKRSNTLKNKTLTLLEKAKFYPDIVHIFVADEQEYDDYKKALNGTYFEDANLIISAPTLRASRNYIRNYFPEGTKVVNLDDDLEHIYTRVDEKTLVESDKTCDIIFTRGFEELEKTGAKIWGIYAAANPFFMSEGSTNELCYIIGSCWGHIIRHDKDLMLTIEDKEDFERSIQYYVKDGIVVRMNDITVKSKYYSEKGGMQETRTAQRIYESAQYLEKKYPHLCSMYIRKSTGHAELRLRDKTKSKGYKAEPTTSLEGFFLNNGKRRS